MQRWPQATHFRTKFSATPVPGPIPRLLQLLWDLLCTAQGWAGSIPAATKETPAASFREGGKHGHLRPALTRQPHRRLGVAPCLLGPRAPAGRAAPDANRFRCTNRVQPARASPPRVLPSRARPIRAPKSRALDHEADSAAPSPPPAQCSSPADPPDGSCSYRRRRQGRLAALGQRRQVSACAAK